MNRMAWFRLYAEAIDDDKLRLLAFEDRWHFVAILCLKTMGVLDEKNDELRRQRMAIRMGLDLAELDAVKRRLETVGLVSSTFQPIAWKKRQFVSDSSTRRVQAFRKRFKNVAETDQSRADTEQSRAEITPPPDGLDLSAWETWKNYRSEIKKPLRAASIPAAQRKLAAFGPNQMAVVEQSIANGWQGLFDLRDQPKKRGLVM